MKLLAILFVFLPALAVADKETREYIKTEFTPAVKAAEANFKKSCGCPLKITVANSVKTKDDHRLAKYIAESVRDSVEGYCTDAESKKAVCQMKTLELTKEKTAEFKFNKGRGIASTDGQATPGFDMMTQVLDK